MSSGWTDLCQGTHSWWSVGPAVSVWPALPQGDGETPVQLSQVLLVTLPSQVQCARTSRLEDLGFQEDPILRV